VHQTGNCNSEMLLNENWHPVFILVLPDLLGPTSPSRYVSAQYIIIISSRLLLLEANNLI
jgi:hypothetical protein